MKNRKDKIIRYIKEHPECSSKEIHEGISIDASYATIKRMLTQLSNENLILKTGKGKATRYVIAPSYELIQPVDMESYYENEIDERNIIDHFNFSLITHTLRDAEIFTRNEQEHLSALLKKYQKNIRELSTTEFNKELERLAIDLSWKSSQIEGNTYTLLETERLIKEKETATGKTHEEALMLLNHKEAIDFIVSHPDYLNPLSVSKIEDIHSILVKGLDIDKNIRKRRVGISGTNYRPLDNEFQIKEALLEMCNLVNAKKNVFEKTLLILILISYIQPFADGNKRTARIVSNAILMDHKYCPVSFRTIDSVEYKKAMLLFYEQNNISRFKEIFIQQFEFAVETYF